MNKKTINILGNKIAYVDQGVGNVIVFIHGMPTSSYLWRKIIPEVSKEARCIAVDLIGMGDSDKPNIDYNIFDHIKYFTEFINKLELNQMTLCMHGWGSVIGCAYAMQNHDKISGLVFSESHIKANSNWENLTLPVQQFIYKLKTTNDINKLVMQDNFICKYFLDDAVLGKINQDDLNKYEKVFNSIESRKPLLGYANDLPKGKPSKTLELIESYSEYLCTSLVPKCLMYSMPGWITGVDTIMWAKENFKNIQLYDLGDGLHFAQETNSGCYINSLLEWYRAHQ